MLFLLVVLGLLTMTASLIISRYFPKQGVVGKLPAGFRTPILALEFVASQQELTDIFAISPPERRRQVISNLDTGNRADVGFAVLYSLLAAVLACVLLDKAGLSTQWQTITTVAAVVFALTAGTCDVLENTILLRITGHQALTAPPLQLRRLTRLVITKFIALTLSLALTLPHWWQLLQMGSLYPKIWAGLTVLVLLSALTGAFLVVCGRRASVEWLLLLQLAGILSLWARAICLTMWF